MCWRVAHILANNLTQQISINSASFVLEPNIYTFKAEAGIPLVSILFRDMIVWGMIV